jgi:hypothetical protein
MCPARNQKKHDVSWAFSTLKVEALYFFEEIWLPLNYMA